MGYVTDEPHNQFILDQSDSAKQWMFQEFFNQVINNKPGQSYS